MDNSLDGRRYSQEQIRALIQRASQLREERLGNFDQHLSLREIEHIASELDIPADLIRSAALEMERGTETKRLNIFGAPFKVNHSRVFDKPLSDEQWGELVMEIRARTGKRGLTEETGKIKEWHHMVGEGDQGIHLSNASIAVRSTDDQTSVQMEKRFGGLAISAYAMTLFFSSLLMLFVIEGFDGMGLSTVTNFALFFGVIFAALGVVRGTISASAKKQEADFAYLMDRFGQILEAGDATKDDGMPDISEYQQVAAPKPLLDLDDVDRADHEKTVDADRKRNQSR